LSTVECCAERVNFSLDVIEQAEELQRPLSHRALVQITVTKPVTALPLTIAACRTATPVR